MTKTTGAAVPGTSTSERSRIETSRDPGQNRVMSHFEYVLLRPPTRSGPCRGCEDLRHAITA